MANEIYHRSNWGNAVNDIAWGDTYEKFDATNEMFVRSDNYENSKETDKLMAAINPKPSILLTPTAYDNGSLHSVKPVKTFGSELVVNGDFSDGTNNWTPNTNATLSIDNGRLKVAISGAASGYASQNITTVVGKKYNITADAFIGTATKVSLYSAVFGFNDLTANGSYNLTFIATGTSTQIRLYIYGDGTHGFWDNISIKEQTDADFQFSRNSSATRVNEQGLIEDVTDTNLPRIDYTDGTGSLLLEPQSTNLQLRSQEFDNSVWTASRATLTANDAVSPDGTLNAYKLTHTSGSSGYVFDTIPTVNSGDSRSISVFAKYIDDEVFKIVSFTDSGNSEFNLLNGTVTSVFGTITDAKIENYGNGWYRCSCKYTATTTSTKNYGFYLDDASKEGVHIWGAQVEEQSFSTSYIPTSGSTVTRDADVCNNSGSSDLINSTEGVLYCEIAALADDGTSRRISLSDGGSSDRLEIFYGTIANRIDYHIYSGSSFQASGFSLLSSATDFNKIAVKYKENDFALWVNGTEVSTNLSGSTPIGLNKLQLQDASGSNDFYGKVKSVAVYKEALTDEELTALTT